MESGDKLLACLIFILHSRVEMCLLVHRNSTRTGISSKVLHHLLGVMTLVAGQLEGL